MKTKLQVLLMFAFIVLSANSIALNSNNPVEVNIISPFDSCTALNPGDSLELSVNLEYQNNPDNGTFEVYFNGVLQDSGNGEPTFTSILNNITTSGTITVVGSPNGTTEEGQASFEIVIAPTVIEESIPEQLVNGINYTSNSSVTLVLDVPEKEFIYVAGSFNNYTRDDNYLMKRDVATGKYWFELTGLNSNEDYTFQYWVYDLDPMTNSPAEVKIADPFSTLILTEDDSEISNSTYPNMPTYPTGQENEVSVIRTGQSPYNWQVTNFDKPDEDNLVIYEVLLRDFDANRNFQDLIDRIDYFKNLNINAIQLMPIMEFQGNESWGYTTNFHMALDKFYGTSNKFKEFIDLCHQNNIAVILDIALDHAAEKNPLVRLWMTDADGNGTGTPNSQNPYFNENPTHTNSNGSDFNHQQTYTQNYVQRVLEYWTEEFKIDGFRFDNSKGFTQNCPNNETCTNTLQQDRIDVLKQYADHVWNLNPDQYVIFDGLGNTAEEKELADYRYSEGKGAIIMKNLTDSYAQLARGYASNASIADMDHEAHNFLGKRLLGYSEGYDDERLMYECLTTGNTAIPDHNVQNLDIALSRMSAIAAASIAIPGPRIIRQFSDLGIEDSVYTCSDGSYNDDSDTDDYDCMQETKPQPQWTNDWLNDTDRQKIYEDLSRLIELKTTEAVFDGEYDIIPYANDARPRIYISNNALSPSELKDVIIFCNFSPVELTVNGNFPYTGTWYDLMDESGNSTISVPVTSRLIGLQPGQFKIYGNQPRETLSNTEFEASTLKIAPNPVNSSFTINRAVTNVKIVDITGKLVKEFNGDFESNKSYDISQLPQSMYIVQISSANGQQESTKLVKL